MSVGFDLEETLNQAGRAPAPVRSFFSSLPVFVSA